MSVADMGSGELAIDSGGGAAAAVTLDAEGVVALHSYLTAWLTYRRERLARDALLDAPSLPAPYAGD